jgi:hypothetical protein
VESLPTHAADAVLGADTLTVLRRISANSSDCIFSETSVRRLKCAVGPPLSRNIKVISSIQSCLSTADLPLQLLLVRKVREPEFISPDYF